MHKLTEARTGRELILVSIEGGKAMMQRLTDMGLIPGERLKVLHNSGFGPVSILVKGSKVGLGHSLASKIIVKEQRHGE